MPFANRDRREALCTTDSEEHRSAAPSVSGEGGRVSIFVRDRDGWYVRLRLGPRLWFVLGRWEA